MTSITSPAQLNSSRRALTAAFAQWLTPRRVRRYPVILILADVTFFLVIAVGAIRQGTPLSHVFGRDFAAFYSSGRFLLDGRLPEIYNPSALGAFQDSLFGSLLAGNYHPFVNPPLAALLFAPFAWLNYQGGLLVYLITGILCLVAAVMLFRWVMFSGGWPRTGHLLLASLAWYPVLMWLLYGQNTSWAVLLLVAAFLLLRKKHDFAAGVALGLLLYKPQLAVGLALVLLVQRRWRSLLGGALAVGIGTALALAVSNEAVEAYVQWLPQLMSTQLDGTGDWAEHSLFFFAALLLGGPWPTGGDALGLLLTLGALGLVAWWWWRRPWKPGTQGWDLRMAATMALSLLVSPHLYVYDLMLLLLPLGIVWSHYPSGTGQRDLDGGPLLVWTTLLWLSTYAARYLTLTQLKLTAALGLPEIALQVTVPIICVWAAIVYRQAQAAEPTAARAV